MVARRIGWAALALIAVLAIGAFLYVQRMRPTLDVGVGYAARVACGCRYIAGRPIGDCRRDFEPGMALIKLKDDPAKRAVTAYVPLIAKRTVTFDPLLGCQAEPFTGTPHRIKY